jgi:hypothetical protein
MLFCLLLFIEFGTVLGIPAVSPMDEIAAVAGSSRGWVVCNFVKYPLIHTGLGLIQVYGVCFAPSRNIVSKYSVLRTPYSVLTSVTDTPKAPKDQPTSVLCRSVSQLPKYPISIPFPPPSVQATSSCCPKHWVNRS